MSASKRIGDFKYSVMVLEADETSARYAEQRAESIRDDRNWYAVWKCSERQHAYAEIAKQQREQIHTGLSGLMGVSVCSCAVMTEGSTGKTSDWRSEWLYTPGHLNHTDGSLVTSFRVKLRDDKTCTWSVFYFCQICDHLEPTATGDGPSKLNAFQKLHAHDRGEN